jgi:2-polyprenyl-3-methyl-5-hydroxy-6-metoxy-1,4-benzoquinol methylase
VEGRHGSLEASTCRVCGQQQFVKWGDRNAHTLYRCSNCRLVCFLPYPTEEQLKEFYNANYHAKRGYDGKSTKAGELRRQMYLLDVAELESTVSPSGKFLDVGCAEGTFLTCLSNKWERLGIDISEQAVAIANRKPGIRAWVRDISEMEDSAYRVVHLRGVFEHLLYPDNFIATAIRKLAHNGFLVLSTTPNTAGPVPRLFRGRFNLVLPKEHVNYFSPQTIQVLANRHGLRVNRITYPYFGTPYCSFAKDLARIPLNYVSGQQSPPFWGNILTAYLQA